MSAPDSAIANIRVTMNTYVHVFEAAKHEAAGKLDALLAGVEVVAARP